MWYIRPTNFSHQFLLKRLDAIFKLKRKVYQSWCPTRLYTCTHFLSRIQQRPFASPYADDTVFMNHSPVLTDLQLCCESDLALIRKWCEDKRMVIKMKDSFGRQKFINTRIRGVWVTIRQSSIIKEKWDKASGLYFGRHNNMVWSHKIH